MGPPAAQGRADGLRVLHVAEAVRGGVATYLRTLVQAQRDDPAFNGVQVLVPDRHAGELATIADHVTALPATGGRLATAFALARHARALCAQQKIDVVHLHSTFAGCAARLLHPGARALIYCPHGWAFDREGSLAMRLAVRGVEALLAPRSTAIVAISEHEYSAGRSLGIAPTRLHLIRNGLAPAAAVDAGPDPWPAGPGPRLLFVGRFDRQKAFDVFVEVAQRLPRAHCVAIGDFSVDAPRSIDVLPSNLRMPGWQSNAAVARWMQHAHALIMPSRWEGFGLTAVEAMRAALPVIASRVGGLQEIVVDGTTGWLVPPADADAIVDLLQHVSRTELRARGVAGQQRYARHFTAARMHAEVLALYRQCLAQAPEPLRTAPGARASAP